MERRVRIYWATEQRALGNLPYLKDGQPYPVGAEVARTRRAQESYMADYNFFRNLAAQKLGWKRNFR